MKKKCPNPQCRIDISGIKISRELIQFNWLKDAEKIVPGLPFFCRIAENKINITFLGMGRDKKNSFSFCCVETEYFDQVQQLMKQDPEIQKNVEMINSVGTLTLFPHQSNFKLLGLVLTELGRNGLPIYAIGTSISALTFSTKYSLLNEAINKLGQVLNLPPDHAPFRPEFRVKQI
jgi:aspartokinase